MSLPGILCVVLAVCVVLPLLAAAGLHRGASLLLNTAAMGLRGRDYAWERTALGAGFVPAGERWGGRWYSREDGGLHATLGPCARVPAADPTPCRLTIQGLPLGLEVVPAWRARAEGIPQVRTGDPALEDVAGLTGEPERVLALLDARCRSIVATLHRTADLEIVHGQLTVLLPESIRAEQGSERVRLGLELAERLCALDTPDRLLERATADPCAPVRAQALLLLGDRAVELAGRDPDVTVTALGEWLAAEVDPDGPAPLLTSTPLPPALLLPLLRRLPAPSRAFDRALVALTRHASPSVRVAAVGALARRRGPGDHLTLRLLVAQSPHVDVVSAGVVGLRDWEHPDRTAALVGVLDREPPVDRKEAVRALGDFGDVSAVEPLLALCRGLRPDALATEARAAVARIQGRAGVGRTGELALVDGGGLSLAPGTGEVGLVEGEDGIGGRK